MDTQALGALPARALSLAKCDLEQLHFFETLITVTREPPHGNAGLHMTRVCLDICLLA